MAPRRLLVISISRQCLNCFMTGATMVLVPAGIGAVPSLTCAVTGASTMTGFGEVGGVLAWTKRAANSIDMASLPHRVTRLLTKIINLNRDPRKMLVLRLSL
jgi:hypothetical protein